MSISVLDADTEIANNSLTLDLNVLPFSFLFAWQTQRSFASAGCAVKAPCTPPKRRRLQFRAAHLRVCSHKVRAQGGREGGREGGRSARMHSRQVSSAVPSGESSPVVSRPGRAVARRVAALAAPVPCPRRLPIRAPPPAVTPSARVAWWPTARDGPLDLGGTDTAHFFLRRPAAVASAPRARGCLVGEEQLTAAARSPLPRLAPLVRGGPLAVEGAGCTSVRLARGPVAHGGVAANVVPGNGEALQSGPVGSADILLCQVPVPLS